MALVVGAAVLCVAPAGATSLAPLTIDQMTDGADLIVRGTITDVWTTEVDGVIYTRADLQVSSLYKGSYADTHLTLESLGGTFEGMTMDVDAAARYSVGEEVFAFLDQHAGRGTYSTVGMYLGKYTIKQNPTDGADMVVRFTVPYSRVYDARFVPNPSKEQRVSVSALEDAVRARVSLGWDGKAIPGVSAEHLRQINRLQPGVR